MQDPIDYELAHVELLSGILAELRVLSSLVSPPMGMVDDDLALDRDIAHLRRLERMMIDQDLPRRGKP